jgi:hypothetical protein
VEMDRIRSPVSQEAVPWPSASCTMSAATHAVAPMEATVSRLGREGSVEPTRASGCTATKDSTLDGGARRWESQKRRLAWPLHLRPATSNKWSFRPQTDNCRLAEEAQKQLR